MRTSEEIYRRIRWDPRFDPARFTRVHRAHLVNLEQVKGFKSDTRGNLEAVMHDGARVPVSRSRAKEIRSLGR